MHITNKPGTPAGTFSAPLVVTMGPMAPDSGDAVTIQTGEIPVDLAWGATSQLAATSVALYRVITHAPGHMSVSDLRDQDLTILQYPQIVVLFSRIFHQS